MRCRCFSTSPAVAPGVVVVAPEADVAPGGVELALELEGVLVVLEHFGRRALPQLLRITQRDQRVAALEVARQRRVVGALAAAEVVRAVPLALVVVGEDDPAQVVDVHVDGRGGAGVEGLREAALDRVAVLLLPPVFGHGAERNPPGEPITGVSTSARCCAGPRRPRCSPSVSQAVVDLCSWWLAAPLAGAVEPADHAPPRLGGRRGVEASSRVVEEGMVRLGEGQERSPPGRQRVSIRGTN